MLGFCMGNSLPGKYNISSHMDDNSGKVSSKSSRQSGQYHIKENPSHENVYLRKKSYAREGDGFDRELSHLMELRQTEGKCKETVFFLL